MAVVPTLPGYELLKLGSDLLVLRESDKKKKTGINTQHLLLLNTFIVKNRHVTIPAPLLVFITFMSLYTITL